ncbi:MAG: hypothetical protein ACK6AO_16195 [Planctomycetota bacterium]|jgi:hypothetical protein
MSDPNRNNSGDQSELPATVSQPGNLLDAALAHLPAEQRQALAQKALERKLDIDAKAVEADNRHRASSVDMANTIHQVRALEDSTKSDYTVRAEYETASGRTNVEIKKSNNTVIIVIAIVIAIIVLITFSK